MKSTKKFLSILLSLVMIISIIPLSKIMSKASGPVWLYYTWTYDETTKTLTITGSRYIDGLSPDEYSFEKYEDDIEYIIVEADVPLMEGSFSDCDNLVSITVNSNNPYFVNDEYGVLYNKDKTILIQYPIGNARTTYTIPNGVKYIGSHSFEHNNNLTNVSIPDSVIHIYNLSGQY